MSKKYPWWPEPDYEYLKRVIEAEKPMFQHCNDLKTLRMELALDLHNKAQTQHIYEAIDKALERAAYLGVRMHEDRKLVIENVIKEKNTTLEVHSHAHDSDGKCIFIEDVNELEFPPV